MQLIRIDEPGGPEVMRLVEGPVPTPGPGEALVKIEAAGVNFVDIYVRSGVYESVPPLTPGSEGAGRVVDVGPGVDEFQAGDRVVWALVPGSYAQYQVIPAAMLVSIPEEMTFHLAAAAMLQGITAHYLAVTTYPLKPGDTCLVQAAAGGVGQLLCQIAKMRGARVIGTAGSREKAAVAREAGADEVILYKEQDFVAAARQLTEGVGVQVAYDTVGKDTYRGSLDSLARRGCLVLVGQPSGPVSPIDPKDLHAKGSLYLTRPAFADHIATRQDLLWRANDVLGWVAAGQLRVKIDRTYPLAEVAEAHRALASRQIAGKVLLIP